MSAYPKAPELQGIFGQSDGIIHDSMGDVVLGDLQRLQQSGNWLDNEIHIARHPLGSAVLYGDCLADGRAVDAALDKALVTNNPKALTYLPGSYTTLLFEPDRLTALGDLANQYPLYYQKDGNGIAYSSVTQSLRDHTESAPLDPLTVAGRLALSLPTDLVSGRSAIKGISRLDGGHMLTVDRHSGVLTTGPYETFDSPDSKTIDDAAAMLREALLEAARLRASSGHTLSADFSGGLDSTAAAYLLARETEDPLRVSTLYTAGLPSADLDQVRRLLALPVSNGLFDAREYAQPLEQSEYRNLLDAPLSDEPDSTLMASVGAYAYSQFVYDQGGTLHINGSAADCLLDADPTVYLGDWMRAGSYTRFVRGAAEVARIARTSPFSVAKQAIIRSKLTPSKDLTVISRILTGDRDPDVLLQGGWLFGAEVAPQWLTPAMRKELSGLALAQADAMRQEPSLNYGNHIAYSSLRNISYDQIGSMRRAAGQGMRQRAVYMDHSVIRACLSIPASLRMNPWVFKAILAKATEGLIPPEVTQRDTKGDYTQQAVYGLRQALPDLEELLRHSRLAEMGVIDPVAVQKTFDRIPFSTDLPWGAIDTFAATELWLRNLSKLNAGSPPPPHIISREAPQDIACLADDTVLCMPPQTLMVVLENGGISLQLAKHKYYRHNANTVELVKSVQEGGSFGAVITWFIASNPGVPEKTIRAAVNQEVRKLIDWGILAEGKGTFSITQGSAHRMPSASPMTRQNQERVKARLRDYPIAVGGFALAIVFKRLPLGVQTRALQGIHRYWARRPASETNAAHIYTAVQNVAQFHPTRAACFEVTAATVIAAALKKRRINLTIGVSSDLSRFHAWPETNGNAIQTDGDPLVEGVFEPLFSV